MAKVSEANGPDLEYTRGDTAPLRVTFTRKGSPIDLTGYTGLVLTVNTELNPTDNTNEQAALTGTLTGTPTDGIVDFEPADQVTSDAFVPAAGLWYDIQGVDAGGRKATLGKGPFTINQDITKA